MGEQSDKSCGVLHSVGSQKGVPSGHSCHWGTLMLSEILHLCVLHLLRQHPRGSFNKIMDGKCVYNCLYHLDGFSWPAGPPVFPQTNVCGISSDINSTQCISWASYNNWGPLIAEKNCCLVLFHTTSILESQPQREVHAYWHLCLMCYCNHCSAGV